MGEYHSVPPIVTSSRRVFAVRPIDFKEPCHIYQSGLDYQDGNCYSHQTNTP